VHLRRSRRQRTCRRRRTLHRVTNSISAKRKSPTSAWRRSMPSTRRTQDRFGASSRKPAGAAAEAAAAEAAEAAEVAEVAEAAAAAAAAAEPAVCRGGDLAAFARPDCFPITLTNTSHHGRVRQGRPGQSMYDLQWCPRPCVGRPTHGGRMDFQPLSRNASARLDERNPVVEECALHRRAGVAGQVRVLTT
jgi:hypothetical protein